MNTRRTTKRKELLSESQELSQLTVQEKLEPNSQLSFTLSTAYQPQKMQCRTEEKQIIRDFIKDCLTSNGQAENRVLYISGVPGVGKTIATDEVVREFKRRGKTFKSIFRYINAMQLVRKQDIYKAINQELFRESKLKKVTLVALHQKLIQNQKVKIIVIDEVDFLMTKEQTIYYNLFEWSNNPETKLCFIIIANTMDFPERLMPKITSRIGNKRLVFRPYTQKQVEVIIRQRIHSSKRFTKNAIVYACKKLSSFTSDIRKILTVLRISLDDEPVDSVIGIDVIVKNWRSASEAEGESWQEELHDSCRLVLDVIKAKGGRVKESTIVDSLKTQHGFKGYEINLILNQLAELNIISLKKVKEHCSYALYATLLKI